MIESLMNLPKRTRQLFLLFVDMLLVGYSGFFTISLYTDPMATLQGTTVIIMITTLVAVYSYRRIGLYDSVVQFMTDDVFRSIILGISFAAAGFLVLTQLFTNDIPVVASLIFGSMAFLITSLVRFVAKDFIRTLSIDARAPVLVYGAGSAGRQLVSALQVGEEYSPVAFLDDDKHLQGKKVQGLKVYSHQAINSLIHEFGVRKILLAIPSASIKQRKRVLSILENYQVEVKTVAGAAEIISGRVQINQLRDVAIEDLLGREPVKPVKALMRECVENKSVLVTGAGGSIGSELCRQLIQCRPQTLVLLDISEFSLYQIERELTQYQAAHDLNVEVISVLGSVLNEPLLDRLMEQFSVDTVYHAAAYKHVPLVEFNVVEGVRNNVFGTLSCAQAAKRARVGHFVLISTDKAVRPTNFMGATKRVAELILQGLSQGEGRTKFSMVRFGNVLGSSGSVVPLFKEQILNGGPVTVTHKEITRYFMTIPEASQLVIQAGAMAKGGDVFVLDMGDPVSIASLAERMIHLMGFEVKKVNSQDGIEIVYTGLRPGEKLYEELLVGANNVEGTIHPRIMTASEVSLPMQELTMSLSKLDTACLNHDCDAIHRILCQLPLEFNHSQISDHFWKAVPDRLVPVANVLTINSH